MAETIMTTNFNFPDQISVYKGKVREVYHLKNDMLIMIATDRLSAFDVVMPKGIPFKGQILNQIATKMMSATSDISSKLVSGHSGSKCGHWPGL